MDISFYSERSMDPLVVKHVGSEFTFDELKKILIQHLQFDETMFDKLYIRYYYQDTLKDVLVQHFAHQVNQLKGESISVRVIYNVAHPLVETEGKDININHPKWENDRYFSGYTTTNIHYDMLRDERRTDAYRDAILGNQVDFEGKVVLDVGCGTGILSIFCAQAGAKKVYAIEASGMAKHAATIFKKNHYDDVIELINDRVENIELPVDKVDVIVSEWMGIFLLYEGMLETVIYARDKWLKPEGKIYPSKAALHLVPVNSSVFNDKIEFFSNPVYGVDMSCLVEEAKSEFAAYPQKGETLNSEWVCTQNPQTFFNFDIKNGDISETREFSQKFEFELTQDFFNGFGSWFDVTFEGTSKEVVLSTHPDLLETHWKQDIFLFGEHFRTENGEKIQGTIKVKQSEWKRHYIVLMELKIKDEDYNVEWTL